MKKVLFLVSATALSLMVVANFNGFGEKLRLQSSDKPFTTEVVQLEEGANLRLSRLYKSDKLQINSQDFKAAPGAELAKYKSNLNNFDSFRKYALFIAEKRGYGYFANGKDGDQTLPDFLYSTYNEDKGYDFDKTDDFGAYYHGIFKNKLLREQAFNFAVAAYVNASNRFPADWLPAASSYVDELIDFVNSGKFPSASLEDFVAPDYWSGFIVRRVHVDNVPKAEILQYLAKVKQTLATIKPDAHSHFKTVIVNSELELKLEVSQVIATNVISGKHLVLKRPDMISLKGNTYIFTKYNWPLDDEVFVFEMD